jgi:glutathione S-transferase
VLQIGADIYCDSQLIMRELERRHPSPGFYPVGRGAADALAWWAEKTMFSPAVSIAFAKRPDALPEGFLEDRAKFSGRNIDPAAMKAAVPNLLDQLRAHFDWLNQMLTDGRSFLQGSAASLADLAAYHPVWFLQRNFGPLAPPLDGFPRLLSWAERVAAIGHGRRSPMTSEQALDVARTATSIASATPDPRDPVGRKPGQTVTVTPDDTGRDPVIGELVASGVHEIVIRRSDSAIGEVCVHFSTRRLRSCTGLAQDPHSRDRYQQGAGPGSTRMTLHASNSRTALSGQSRLRYLARFPEPVPNLDLVRET